MADQPLVQSTIKASTLTPITNPAASKSKGNTYSKPRIVKCYMYDEPGHKSNECSKRRQVNMAGYEEEDDMLIEIEPEDSSFIEEHGYPVSYVI